MLAPVVSARIDAERIVLVFIVGGRLQIEGEEFLQRRHVVADHGQDHLLHDGARVLLVERQLFDPFRFAQRFDERPRARRVRRALRGERRTSPSPADRGAG